MKIKEILTQSRRDFTAIMECEHCGAEAKLVSGYDDANFHQNVIPSLICEDCGKEAPESYRALAPKHDEGTTL